MEQRASVPSSRADPPNTRLIPSNCKATAPHQQINRAARKELCGQGNDVVNYQKNNERQPTGGIVLLCGSPPPGQQIGDDRSCERQDQQPEERVFLSPWSPGSHSHRQNDEYDDQANQYGSNVPIQQAGLRNAQRLGS